MSKIYKKLTTDFTVVSNEILKHNLSLRAIGLYLYIVQKPNDWDFSMVRVASQLSDGEMTVRGAVKELEEAGFLERHPHKTADGKFVGYDWYIYDKPKLSVGKPSVVNQPTVQPPTVNTPTLIRTNEVNTNLVNIKEESGRAIALTPIKKEVPYKLIEQVVQTDFEEIAEHYNVPLAFVASKYEDMVLWAGQQPNSGKLRGRNWRLTLMNWVKKDAQKIRKEASEHVSKRGIDARNIR